MFGGYIRFDKGTLFIHYKKNKAKAIKLVDAKSMKFDPSVLRYISVIELKSKFDLPIGDLSVITCVIFNFLSYITSRALTYYYPFLDKNNVLQLNFDDKKTILIKISLLFNFFDILLIIVKTVWENIWKSKNKKKI